MASIVTGYLNMAKRVVQGELKRRLEFSGRVHIVSVIIVIMLGALVYLQFRQWRHFDWTVFWHQTSGIKKLHLFSATLLIYATFFLRALRWRIFLHPTCRTSTGRLLGPTLIGFTGLSLLGRPGEFARPYLIARKQNLAVPSQIAVWAVERIFDIGAFTVMMVVDIFKMDFSENIYLARYGHDFLVAGVALIGLVIAMAGGAFAMRRNGRAAAAWVHRRFGRLAPNFARQTAAKIHAFGEGLNTIHDINSFLKLVGVSLLIWFLIALCFEQVMHAYSAPLRQWTVAQAILVVGFSMVGSLVQLPAVGGGAQLATIKAMQAIFGIRPEMAVSCGIMLWLINFVAVIPAGLLLAHREHVSLNRISEVGSEQRAVHEPATQSSF
jgi:hypothetical protein